MKSMVIYASEFGNTQKIAEAIAAALNDAEVVYADNVAIKDLASFDYIVVGSPTQKLNYVEAMGNFLNRIPDNGLKDVQFAAFDTRISIPDVKSTASRLAARVFLHRYAAKPIADVLKDKGGIEIIEPEGFFVLDTEGPLKSGELERAAAWGRQIMQRIASRTPLS